MAYGFRSYDENGNVDVTITDRLTRYLGILNTGTGNSSANIDASVPGAIYWFFVLDQYNGIVFSRPPQVTLSGTTLSWNFGSAAGPQRYAVNIVYGIR